MATTGCWECVERQMGDANGGYDILLGVDGTEVRPIVLSTERIGCN